MQVGDDHCANVHLSLSQEAGYSDYQSATGSHEDDGCEEAGSSHNPPAAQQRVRPKSKYTLAGFVGFWASLFAATGSSRPSTAELKGRQPGQDGARVVYCTLDTATGLHHLSHVVLHVIYA